MPKICDQIEVVKLSFLLMSGALIIVIAAILIWLLFMTGDIYE